MGEPKKKYNPWQATHWLVVANNRPLMLLSMTYRPVGGGVSYKEFQDLSKAYLASLHKNSTVLAGTIYSVGNQRYFEQRLNHGDRNPLRVDPPTYNVSFLLHGVNNEKSKEESTSK